MPDDDEHEAEPGEEPGLEDEGPTGPDAIETGELDLRELAAAAAKARRRSLRGELTVRRQGEREVTVGLEGSRTLIGRDPACDIVINDPEVSRRHAQIEMGQGGFFELVDQRSRNGLSVKGHRTDRLVLLDGDRFQVGSARFTVHIREELPESESPA